MKILGTGRVWNPKTHSLAWEFVDGSYETEKVEFIELAKLNGFEMEGDMPEISEPEKPRRGRPPKE